MTTHLTTSNRYQTLLKVNEAARSQLTVEEVFSGMCQCLSTVIPYVRAGLTVYDPKEDGLRIVALHGEFHESVFHVGDLLDRQSSQNGRTFEQQQKTVRNDIAREYEFASELQSVKEGLRSLCSVPLIVRGESIGVVTLLDSHRMRFSTALADFVQEAVDQIATAISSLMPHCPVHSRTRLFCPKCVGSLGGQQTSSKYRDQLSAWGKRGGRNKHRRS